MSENKEYLSKQALIITGIIALFTFVVGIILLLLGYNEAFYSESSAIRAIFEAITFTGEAIFFIILIAVFYIVYDKTFAKNLALSLLASAYINETIKGIAQDPRPITNIDLTDEPYFFTEPDFGFPSGHSQNGVATWGYMAYHFKDKKEPSHLIPFIMSVWIFLVAISRIIIGVHDLQDIIGGLLIGIVFLNLFIFLEPTVSEKIGAMSLQLKIILVVIVSVALFAIGTLLFPTAGLGLVSNAPSFTDTGYFAIIGGVVLGLGIGYTLENEYVKYEPSELDTKTKIINLIIGLVVLFAVYFGMEALKGTFNSVLYRYIRYALVGFILTYLVPMLFKKINKT